ncbi:hypothetical protein PHJA_000395900, partial [Phtheirospermum japonicum]
ANPQCSTSKSSSNRNSKLSHFLKPSFFHTGPWTALHRSLSTSRLGNPTIQAIHPHGNPHPLKLNFLRKIGNSKSTEGKSTRPRSTTTHLNDSNLP